MTGMTKDDWGGLGITGILGMTRMTGILGMTAITVMTRNGSG